jgi:molybdopterin molybdotransferase
MLAAFLTHRRYQPIELGIARDVRDDLRTKIAAGLQADALLLSGGVSAGVLDLVPSVLAELGVRQVFHKVHLKPGKPIWFGTYTTPDGAVKPVFGLPGNPVSSLICFELFVRPALAKLCDATHGDAALEKQVALAEPFMHRGDRPTYWPGRLADDGRGQALVWQGSGDLRTIAGADCVICFPEGDRQYAAGEPVTIRLL